MDLLKPRLGGLRQGINLTTSTLKVITKIDASDHFLETMTPFLDEASKQVTVIESDFTKYAY